MYKAGDVDDSLKQLWMRLAREMFETGYFIIPSEANAEKWVRFIREGLAEEKSFLLVARSDGKPVGFVQGSVPKFPLEVSEPAGTIDNLYVLPEFRGRGIGKKLMAEGLKTLKTRGVKAVRLSVLKENRVAIKLYEKLGFKIYQYGMEKAFRKRI